jgi:hypothetical protein
MYWLYFVILIVGGILGAAGLIIKNKPSAAELIGKLTPWQGWIGILLLLWGIWDLIQSFGLLALGLIGIFYLATACVEIVLGFLLGFSLIAKYTGEKGEKIFKSVSPFQGIFGIIAILLGLFWLLTGFGIFNFLFFV